MGIATICTIPWLLFLEATESNRSASKHAMIINPLTQELNPSAQRCLQRFLLGILIFKELTAQRLYKSFGVKGLIPTTTAATMLKTIH
jgi:hypothetical protein